MKLAHSKYALTFALLAALSSTALAKKFTSKYCEFELPSGWECALEGSEYVCQSDNADRKKEAIIILAAKIRGEQDNLDEYMAYLKKNKEYNLPGGKKQVSEPKNTKMSNINGQQWVDALHLASEVPGFYTRYLATVKEDLGVAVTFSVTKDLYSAYQPIMDKLVSTLRVFRQKQQGLSDLRAGAKPDENFQDTTFNPNANMDMTVNRTKARGSDGEGSNDMLLIIGAVVVGAVVLVVMKGKKKKGGKKKG